MRRPRFLAWVVVLALLLGVCVLAFDPFRAGSLTLTKPGGLEGPYAVLAVSDGDTIRIMVNGKEERLRLLQIDAPEMDTAGGRGSKRALERLLQYGRGVRLYRKVELEFDGRRRDRYGRLLSYVWCGDTNLSVEMVRRGEAEPFFRYGPGPYDRALRQ